MPHLHPETSLHVAFRDAPDNLPSRRKRRPRTATPITPTQLMAVDAIATITCLGAGFTVGQIPGEPLAPWIGSVILVTGLIFAVSLLSTYLRNRRKAAQGKTPGG